MGNREIKPSNKTKEEIVEGFSLRLTTPPRAREPVLEVETDLADSGAQSGSVSSSWLVICQWRTAIFVQVKESGTGPFDFNVVHMGQYQLLSVLAARLSTLNNDHSSNLPVEICGINYTGKYTNL